MPSATLELTVKDAYIEQGSTVINGVRLRRFQEEVFDALGKYRKVLLRAPTGSGKTMTLVLGAVKSCLEGSLYPVVGVYPSRALVYDQARSVRESLKRMGFEQAGDTEFRGRVVINGEDRGECVFNVYVLTSERKEVPKDVALRQSIVLTVPEYPFMYLTAMNMQGVASQVIEAAMKFDFDTALAEVQARVPRSAVREAWNYFSAFFNGYWFVDEFHLYSGIARGSATALVEMFERYNAYVKGTKTVVFSSATPVPVQVDKVIEARSTDRGERIRKRTKVVFHLAVDDAQQEAVNRAAPDPRRKTAVILDRVYYIAQLCSKVNDAALVWGLDRSYGNCRRVDSGLEREGFIIGNQAISFGIDLDLDMGFIHAHDAETFIQRFGRFGRHGEGEAEVHVFLRPTWRAVEALRKYSGREVTYEEFLDIIRNMYEMRADDRLDATPFSRARHDVLLRAFSLLFAVAEGEQVYSVARSWYPGRAEQLKLRPSSDEYFYVFAYRPGGLKGRWCDGEEDELFTMLRNFQYDWESGCFRGSPLKEYPALVPRQWRESRVKCGFMPFEEFVREADPVVVFSRQNFGRKLRNMKEFEKSYVVVLTRECVDWKDFGEMAKLVSTYENAMPIFRDVDMSVVIGLALFI